MDHLKLGLSFTSKVHILCCHVAPVLEQTVEGLAFMSEQAMEASHSEFDKVWRKYKIKDVNRPNFPM